MKSKSNGAGNAKPAAALLGDELRLDILAACDQREVTAQEFVDPEGGVTLDAVNYHVRELLRYRFIYVTRTEPSGGSERRYYRSLRQAVVSDEEFAQMKPNKQQVLVERTVGTISERAKDAAAAGTIFKQPNCHITWDAEWLDPERHDLLMAKLMELHELFDRFKEEMRAEPALYAEAIFTTLALLGFESPPEEEKRPNRKPRRARPGEKARPKPRA
jgi:DNA-binding transcriptional ArsR family regulator